MAHAPTATLAETIRHQADALFARIGQGFNAYLETRARSAELDRFFNMSDEELAARGLTRDGIVQHVFRDKLIY